LLIKPKRRYVQTTFSRHWMRKYPNLVRQQAITRAEQVWVSDITYIKTDEGNSYLTMITDAYTRKIMGYKMSQTMEASATKEALQMAINNRSYKESLIHHSDRGLQYCSKEYVELAESNGMQMSMTEQSDPYENALAERMNRTIKEEFGLNEVIKDHEQARLIVEQAILLYNTKRPHLALNYRTPDQVHKGKSR
jgi:putative transposase